MWKYAALFVSLRSQVPFIHILGSAKGKHYIIGMVEVLVMGALSCLGLAFACEQYAQDDIPQHSAADLNCVVGSNQKDVHFSDIVCDQPSKLETTTATWSRRSLASMCADVREQVTLQLASVQRHGHHLAEPKMKKFWFKCKTTAMMPISTVGAPMRVHSAHHLVADLASEATKAFCLAAGLTWNNRLHTKFWAMWYHNSFHRRDV